jgi:hypothetical protein
MINISNKNRTENQKETFCANIFFPRKSCRLFYNVEKYSTAEQTTDSNKSPTKYNNFTVYYPDVYLQLNMFRAFSRPSSGPQ